MVDRVEERGADARGQPRPRRTRGWGEGGSAVVEFAVVAPVVFLLLIGMIEFGLVFSKHLSLRDGVRAVARQGAINIGSFNNAAPTCTLVGASASNDVEDLMCLAKSQISATGARVKVLFDNPTLTASGSTYAVGNAVVVCVTYPLAPLTALLSPILGGKYAMDKAAFRIETLPSDGQTQTAGAETDPSGSNWSWCQS